MGWFRVLTTALRHSYLFSFLKYAPKKDKISIILNSTVPISTLRLFRILYLVYWYLVFIFMYFNRSVLSDLYGKTVESTIKNLKN